VADRGYVRPFSQLDPDRERFPFDFADLQEVSGFEKPEEVFEAMGRLDHPNAKAVLAIIGKHASDKTTAKAARRPHTRRTLAAPPVAKLVPGSASHRTPTYPLARLP
jgi:hypothetical protein